MVEQTENTTYLGAINGCCPAYGVRFILFFLVVCVDLNILVPGDAPAEEWRTRLPDMTTHTGRATDTFL